MLSRLFCQTWQTLALLNAFRYPPRKAFQVFTIGETKLRLIPSQNRGWRDGLQSQHHLGPHRGWSDANANCNPSFSCKMWRGSFPSPSSGFLLCKVRKLALLSHRVIKQWNNV